MTVEYKILLVEDDPGIRLALHDFLAQNGFSGIVIAANGAQGLEQARVHIPHLIISDITMPEMDGFTFIQELRNDPALRAIPVIVLTGRGEMVDLFEMAEIHNYLIKPVQPKDLLAMVNRVLGKKENSVSHGSDVLLDKIEQVEHMMGKKGQNSGEGPKTLLQKIKTILEQDK